MRTFGDLRGRNLAAVASCFGDFASMAAGQLRRARERLCGKPDAGAPTSGLGVVRRLGSYDSGNRGTTCDVADLLDMCVPCDELAPGAVREKLRDLCDLNGALEDAMLVASELVTNAVRHSLCTQDEFVTVRISRNGWLRIAVVDPGASDQSAEIADRPIELGGLGLKVVEQLAARWGAERRSDGYRVWAELELPN